MPENTDYDGKIQIKQLIHMQKKSSPDCSGSSRTIHKESKY